MLPNIFTKDQKAVFSKLIDINNLIVSINRDEQSATSTAQRIFQNYINSADNFDSLVTMLSYMKKTVVNDDGENETEDQVLAIANMRKTRELLNCSFKTLTNEIASSIFGTRESLLEFTKSVASSIQPFTLRLIPRAGTASFPREGTETDLTRDIGIIDIVNVNAPIKYVKKYMTIEQVRDEKMLKSIEFNMRTITSGTRRKDYSTRICTLFHLNNITPFLNTDDDKNKYRAQRIGELVSCLESRDPKDWHKFHPM